MASVEQIPLHPAPALAVTPASASRVRNRLGVMLVLVVVAAAVAAASLAALLVNQEAIVAVAAAAVLLGVAVVIAFSIILERRRLRRESVTDGGVRVAAEPTPLAPATAAPMPSVAGNGSDLFDEPKPARATAATKSKKRKRGQGDELLDEILNWPARGA